MFSQTTEYALRSMACLALYQDQLVPTTTVAEMTRVPHNYLSKVLQQLASAGLLTGRRGVGGGYRLARAVENITLLEVLRAVSTVERIHTCPLGLANHGSNLCALHSVLDRASAMLIELTGSVTLRDLLNNPRSPNKPLCDTKATAQLTVSGGLKVKAGVFRPDTKGSR